MKQGAIFDMDGLLFDTETVYQDCWTRTAPLFGQTPHPDFPLAVCGSSGEFMLRTVNQFYPDVDAREFCEACVRLVNEQLEIHVPIKPGAVELLEFFKQAGVKLAVASSSKYSMIEGNLKRSGLLPYFDAIVSGYEVPKSKPFPDIFLKSAELLGCAPEDCYVLEDSLNGVRAGVAAGCATIMIPDTIAPTDEMREICTAIYPSLSDFQKVLENELNNK